MHHLARCCAVLVSIDAKQHINFFVMGICKYFKNYEIYFTSLGPWAFDPGPRIPVTKNYESG